MTNTTQYRQLNLFEPSSLPSCAYPLSFTAHAESTTKKMPELLNMALGTETTQELVF